LKWSNECRRRLGEFLREMEKNPGTRLTGGDRRTGGTKKEPPVDIPTLADLGITKKESRRYEA
jgi:hypothetical protein